MSLRSVGVRNRARLSDIPEYLGRCDRRGSGKELAPFELQIRPTRLETIAATVSN